MHATISSSQPVDRNHKYVILRTIYGNPYKQPIRPDLSAYRNLQDCNSFYRLSLPTPFKLQTDTNRREPHI